MAPPAGYHARCGAGGPGALMSRGNTKDIIKAVKTLKGFGRWWKKHLDHLFISNTQFGYQLQVLYSKCRPT